MFQISRFFLLVVSLLIGGSSVALGQTLNSQEPASDLITVRRNDLPPDVLARIQIQEGLQDTRRRIDQYGEWVGIGKEIGVAVNEGLEAVTDKAEKFANTTPGKVTIFVIIWKVIGRELLGIFVGVPLIGLWTFVFFYAWRSLFRGRIIKIAEGDGKKIERFIEPLTNKWLADGSVPTVAIILPVVYAIIVAITVGSVIF